MATPNTPASPAIGGVIHGHDPGIDWGNSFTAIWDTINTELNERRTNSSTALKPAIPSAAAALSPTADKNGIIYAENWNDIRDSFYTIHPNAGYPYQNRGAKAAGNIIYAADVNALNTDAVNYANRDLTQTTSTGNDCYTICVGGCYSACYAGCGNACQGTCSIGCGSACINGCTGGCQGCAGCTGSCSGCAGCGSNCTGCGSACSSGCDGNCSTLGAGCYMSCSTACSATCKAGCNTECNTGCGSSCKGACGSSCEGGCSTGCGSVCINGCTGGAMAPS